MVSTFCVEAVADGVRVGNEEADLKRALELLGFDVVDDGCRARLQLSATGSRCQPPAAGISRRQPPA